MKIGLIVPGFGGDEKDWCIPAHTNMARCLAATNRVHVYALRYPNRRDVYAAHGVTVHSLGGQARRGLGSALLWTSALRSIHSEHSQSPFAVLHSIFGGEAGLVTVIAARLLRVPSVVSILGGELASIGDIGYGQELRWRQQMMNRLSLRFADRVLCGTRQMTQLVRSRMPSSGRLRVLTLPLGVDTAMFSPASPTRPLHTFFRRGDGNENTIPGGEFANILTVGSLIPVKDHETLFRAIALLTNESHDIRLQVIGAGPLDRLLRDFAADLKIADRVDFVGEVPHDLLPDRYREADIFVQSSRHEGEGIAVLEAAATGIPIVGTDVGVLSDLAAKDAAVAVPVQDPAALARGISKALASRVRLGEAARGVAQTEYNLERIGERLIELYDSVSVSEHVSVIPQSLPNL